MKHKVDIIIPAYRGLADTQRCIASVLQAPCVTPWRLIVINDSSPEPELTAWLRDLAARDDRIELHENQANLGFVASVNRGMGLSRQHDVLLLNSDTEVANDWLDRMQRAAYSDARVATVTPFSNNATIFSYPRMAECNALPDGWDTARLDALFARVNAGQSLDVPTGVGFCMYIRRAALDEIGFFDVDQFGKGYGEENDFCIRAQKKGWRNLHAMDTFVHHRGGVSFGQEKKARERAAMATLRRLHPGYEAQVVKFLHDDPPLLARTAVDMARLRADRLPIVLAVSHDRGGGTARHIHELAAHLKRQARFLVLRPAAGKRVSLKLADEREGFELAFRLPQQGDALVAVLRTMGVRHVHFHHLLGHDPFVTRLPDLLATRHDFTVHDYYTWCMQTTLTGADRGYCGEEGDGQCQQCRQRNPVAHHESIPHWRRRHVAFLNAARFVLVPSRDAMARLRRMAPSAALRWVPHTDLDLAQTLPSPRPAVLTDDRPLRIAVIGSLSTIKGADRLEHVAIAAQRREAPLVFHLLGAAYRSLKVAPRASLTVHGPYVDRELPTLLRQLNPDLVWFPAQWPETYSYTLSACLQGGWPVVAPDIGAFAQRLAGRPWSWVCRWNWAVDDWLAFFTRIRTDCFGTGQGPPPPQSHTAVESTLPAECAPERSRSWYAGAYLDGFPVRQAQAPAVDLLQTCLPRHDATLGMRVRARVLTVLAYMRSTRVLASVARAIPPHWQTRVKSWLRR